MSVLNLRVNGQTRSLDVDAETPLLYVLSDDLALRGGHAGPGLYFCYRGEGFKKSQKTERQK